MSIQEKLIIQNFFSIRYFEWDIRGFNILTGGMGSGKSLALKLLYFCEQIFNKTIFSETNLNKDKFYESKYFATIEDFFYQIFPSKNNKNDFKNTIIKYEYIVLAKKADDTLDNSQFSLFDQPIINKFDLFAEWKEDVNKFKWSSNYISNNIEKWRNLFDVDKTPDLMDNVRNSIYNLILADFQNSFPIATMFIPASRAIAAIADSISSRDQFINRFLGLKNYALSFDNISNDIINNILQIKNITVNDKNEPIFELKDGRSITSLELSSGQQELLYLLLLIKDLNETLFRYGESVSVFIEEPCAHLFPKEQKETMEFLVACFSLLQEKKNNEPGHRFFISTHSPYILNTINNILEKGRLIKNTEKINNKDLKKEILDKLLEIPFSYLSIDDVSAYMINDDKFVNSMINKDDNEQYIYSTVIDKIDEDISNDSDKLYNINCKIKDNLNNLVGSI